MKLGENICRLRNRHHMSQGALADALNVSRQSVSKWETGSSIPELEKLIKMSELFGITLDELVGREDEINPPSDPTPPKTTDAQTVYIHSQAFFGISVKQFIGGILLIGSFLLAIVLCGNGFNLAETALLALPVAVCGILCLCAKHALLYCGWVGAAAYWICFFILSRRWEMQSLLLFLGCALVLLMLLLTVYAHRKGYLHIPLWVWIAGTLVLAALTLLLLINLMPPTTGIVDQFVPVRPIG